MLGTIGSIILKYWIEFFLSLVVAGMGFFLKRYVKLEKEERNHATEEREKRRDEKNEKLIKDLQKENESLINSLSLKCDKINEDVDARYIEVKEGVRIAMEAGRDESKADDEILQKQICTLSGEMNCLKAGLLSVQGKEFRDNCRKLLEDGHEISLDEWEDISADHDAYNGLGGNHRGDYLFDLVKKKVENNITESIK